MPQLDRAPERNHQIFDHLFFFEVGVRELIVDELTAIGGQKWFKQRMPGDVLEKCKNGSKQERTIRWMQLVTHHPIYYSDFPDLRKIILKKDNWSGGFVKVFEREDLVKGWFTTLDPIRNKVAHNRLTTDSDVTQVIGVLDQLKECVGRERLEDLVGRMRENPSVSEWLQKLRAEIRLADRMVSKLKPCPEPDVWPQVNRSWWFDEDVLLVDLEPVRSFLGLIDLYRALPRGRGRGPDIERWVAKKYDEHMGSDALSCLDGILRTYNVGYIHNTTEIAIGDVTK